MTDQTTPSTTAADATSPVAELVAFFGDGGIGPTAGQWKRIAEASDEGPIIVTNLIKLRDVAAYPDGHPDTGSSGLAALLRYGAGSEPRIESVGGRVLGSGAMAGIVVGDEEDWDVMIVVRFPSRGAYVRLFQDADYRAVYHHRRAAIARYHSFVMAVIE